MQAKFNNVCEAFAKVEEIQDEYVSMIDMKKDNYESELENINEYKLELERKKNEVHFKLIQRQNSSASSVSKVKVKSVDPPNFGGNIRDYPTFRMDYQRLVTSAYGEDKY